MGYCIKSKKFGEKAKKFGGNGPKYVKSSEIIHFFSELML